MKWLILIFSIFKPFFSSPNGQQMINPMAEFKEIIKDNAMKVVGIFAIASALATLFAAGIVMIAVDIGAQLDQNSSIYFSSMIMAGLIVSILSVLIALGSAKIFTNEEGIKEMKKEVSHTHSASHPLQDALALLIHDFIKEREHKRTQEEEIQSTQRQNTNNQENAVNSPHYPSNDIH